MIWFNRINNLFYTVRDGQVFCRNDGGEWRLSSFSLDVERFLNVSVKGKNFSEYNVSLENK